LQVLRPWKPRLCQAATTLGVSGESAVAYNLKQ
jgi:hypothetical protein